jgi:serine/threonine protein kinase
MPDRVGPYELVRPIGTGGMGQVFLARHVGPEGFEKLIVLKTLRPDHSVDSRFVAMFLDEARLAARLIHPHVVHIFDFGEAGGTYYLAMEYIPGVDVASLCGELRNLSRPLPLALACRIVIDTASGLHYAHDVRGSDGQPLGLVHRDVSPQNILVGYEGAVKVIDFGIAKAAGRLTQTRTGALKGKFAYMSPEQAAGKPIDRRSDIFALGVVFHELVTGKRLFERESETEVLRAVQDCAVGPPSKMSPEVPAAIDEVVMKALSKNRDARYATAHEMLTAVEAFVVENRLPASPAQLATFLRDIYPENVVREATPSSVPDTVASGRRDPPGASLAPTTVSGARRRRTAGMAIGMGLAVVVIGGIATLALRKPQATDPASASAVPHEPSPTQSPRMVKLNIQSAPTGVEVRINGVLLGQTPISKEIEAAAQADLELNGKGLESKREKVSLLSDFNGSFQLDPARVVIPISSNPRGASVTVDRKEIGKTPFDWSVAESETPVMMTFAFPGYVSESKPVTPRQGEIVDVKLKKQPVNDVPGQWATHR